MSKNKSKKGHKTRKHFVLFCVELPFSHKVEVDRTKFKRKKKHKNKED